MMNKSLRALVDQVAETTDRSPNTVELAFGCCEGSYDWTARLAAKTKKHGRGQKILQPAMQGVGETPEAAVKDLLQRFEDWSNPEAAEKKRQDARTLAIVEEMHAKGEIDDDDLAKMKKALLK